MKSISSSSLFQLPRVCGGGRNSGGDARLYRYCGGSSSSSSTIVAKKSKNKRPPPPKDSKPPPPRITSNLKQNLQILRYLKEHQKRKSTTPRPSTSYRRKKVVKEDLPEETELSDDPTTFDLDEDIEGAAPVLLVDGYNVCGYWPKLRKDFMSGRLDIARQNLIDELVTYSGTTDMKVVVVFDAYMSGLRTHKENFFGIDVVYSAETSADAWIEEEVALLRKDGCTEVWVATSDSLEQEIAFDEGAYIWSCKQLISEIEASHKEIERSSNKYSDTTMQGRLLRYGLDPKVVDALKDLRNKLAEKARRC